jgi:hypothetical protein
MPDLAPSDKNRFLGTTSIVKSIKYLSGSISYSTYNNASDILRLTGKPIYVTCNGIKLSEISDKGSEGYNWKQLSTGGILTVIHSGKDVEIGF